MSWNTGILPVATDPLVVQRPAAESATCCPANSSKLPIQFPKNWKAPLNWAKPLTPSHLQSPTLENPSRKHHHF